MTISSHSRRSSSRRLLSALPSSGHRRRMGNGHGSGKNGAPWVKPLVMTLLLLLLAGFGWSLWDGLSRRTPPAQPATVNASNPFTLDEEARLSLALESLIDLEKQQDYGTIYDTMASENLKDAVDRPVFMALGDCALTHLGPLQGYRRPSVKLRRRPARLPGQPPLDEVFVHVRRNTDQVWQKAVFVQNGDTYELQGLYWSATNPAFQHCMQGVMGETAFQQAVAAHQQARHQAGSKAGRKLAQAAETSLMVSPLTINPAIGR